MSKTIKKILPDVQIFFTDNKNKVFYIGVIETYPEVRKMIKVSRTSKGYDYKQVDKMHNISFTCCLGYHHDYISHDEYHAIEKYLNDNYLAKKLIEQVFEKSFNSDDIPF